MEDPARAKAAERRQHAETVYLRRGLTGLGTMAVSGALAHTLLEKVLKPRAYLAINWRLKLFAFTAISVAGFAVGSEKGWLAERDRLLLEDDKREGLA